MEKLPSRPLLLDGATGTRLLAAGMPWGVCPEAWVLEHPEVVRAIQRSYVEAGSEVLYAPTFGANPIRLAAFGLEGQMERMNRDLVSLAREASGGQALVAGDISTAGELPEPFGELTYRDLVACYAVQAGALRDAGADLLVCETFTSLLDARAALLGARTAGLPVLVSVTADEFGRTMMSSETLACLIVMQSLGAAAFGLNCGDGPEKMEFPIRELAAHAKIPVIAKPNAGIPSGQPPRYSLPPEQFAAGMQMLLDAGASVVGGCCGTDERHIALLRGLLDRRVRFGKEAPASGGQISAFDGRISAPGGQVPASDERTSLFSGQPQISGGQSPIPDEQISALDGETPIPGQQSLAPGGQGSITDGQISLSGGQLPFSDERIPLSDGRRAYFLGEGFGLSAEIACGEDMGDALLDAAREPGDAALIRVASPGDARLFAQNAHLLRKPAAFLAEDEEALAAALFLYQGRAVVDARSGVDPKRLAEIAVEYGAVVR